MMLLSKTGVPVFLSNLLQQTHTLDLFSTLSFRNRFQGPFSHFIYDNKHLPLQYEHDVLKPFDDVVRRLGFFGG